jgi:serine/threonine-protein kinase
MQTNRAPLGTLAGLLVLWWLHLHHFLGRMPARVATHFDGAGTPNGWMPRATLATADFIFLVLVLSISVGSAYLVRALPVSLINVPNRDYWFAPERRRESHARLLRHLLWFSCLLVAFLIGVNHLVFHANLRAGDVHVSGVQMVVLLASFVTALIAWIARLYRLFPRQPRA